MSEVIRLSSSELPEPLGVASEREREREREESPPEGWDNNEYLGKTELEINELAEEYEARGDLATAAILYDKAIYHHAAMRAYESLGDYDNAIAQAEKAGDEYHRQRLEAAKANIQFSYDDPKKFENSKKALLEAQKVARQGNPEIDYNLYDDIAELGFEDFDGKIVADIGARDGRFIKLFKELGAKEVYGIDPNTEALHEAVVSGKLDDAHAINTTLENIPAEVAKKIDVAAIFNFIISNEDQPNFFKSLYDILPDGGKALLTIAETETLNRALINARQLFHTYHEQRVLHAGNFPHKYFVTLTKK